MGSRVLLLTGSPGIGKTTAMRRIVEGLAGRKLGGFTTEEIREKGVRVGFGLESFDGKRSVLAHVDIASPHRVSRYGVDIEALGRFVESTLDPAAKPDVILVDEIGKMECLSPRFVAAIERLLEGEIPMVATVAERGGGLIERVKRRPEVVLWAMTRANRDGIPRRALDWFGSS
ncbi:MAG: nucleoside-triphosphatase [Acidithiobacillales bacterium]